MALDILWLIEIVLFFDINFISLKLMIKLQTKYSSIIEVLTKSLFQRYSHFYLYPELHKE